MPVGAGSALEALRKQSSPGKAEVALRGHVEDGRGSAPNQNAHAGAGQGKMAKKHGTRPRTSSGRNGAGRLAGMDKLFL